MSNLVPDTFEKDVRANTNLFHTVFCGTDGIRKLDKIRDKYRIPHEERILAFSRSSGIGFRQLGLSLGGVIITDHAVYTHPSKGSGAEDNRIPFTELCRYLPVQVSDKAPVYLAGENGDINILGGTIISKNPVGQEIEAFLLAMVKHLAKTYDWAAEQRQETISWALAGAKKTLSFSRLDEKTRGILDALEDDTSARREVCMILAADLYRSGNFDEYHNYVSELPFFSSYEDRMQLLAGEQFLDQYLSELSDSGHDFDKALLEEFCKHMEEKEYTDKRFIAYVYAAIRIYDQEKINILLEAAQKAFPENYTDLRVFHGQFFNHRMKSVYIALRDGEELKKEAFGWSDGLGFTPLSYALILKQSDQLKRVLKKGKWKEYYPDGVSEEASALFNYTVLAFLCHYDNDQAALVLKYTSEILRSMERHLKVLKAKQFLMSQVVSAQKSALNTMESRALNGDYDSYGEMEDHIGQASDTLNRNRARLRTIGNEIDEVEEEIQQFIIDSLNQAYTLAQTLRSSDDPLVKLYLRFIDKPSLRFFIITGVNRVRTHPISPLPSRS